MNGSKNETLGIEDETSVPDWDVILTDPKELTARFFESRFDFLWRQHTSPESIRYINMAKLRTDFVDECIKVANIIRSCVANGTYYKTEEICRKIPYSLFCIDDKISEREWEIFDALNLSHFELCQDCGKRDRLSICYFSKCKARRCSSCCLKTFCHGSYTN